jgi:hypothetical protein
VHVKVPVLLEVRVEGDGIEALLDELVLDDVAERIDLGEVEERLLVDAAVLIGDPDATDALGDEDAARSVIGRRDVRRIGEAVGDLDQRDLGIAGKRARGQGDVVSCLRQFLGLYGPHQRQQSNAGHYRNQSHDSLLECLSFPSLTLNQSQPARGTPNRLPVER